MKIGLVLLLLLSCGILGCQSQRRLSTPTPDRVWGEPSNGLRASIEVRETNWSKGDPALVSVVLENVSGDRVNLSTIPSFTFNESEYWCPVDIGGEKHTLTANARSAVSLEKGATGSTSIDLSKLGCDRAISSIWPAQNLYSLVAAGGYSLRLDIEVVGGSQPQWIRSNPVQVAIRD